MCDCVWVCWCLITRASSSNSRVFFLALSSTILSCSLFLWVRSSCRRWRSHSSCRWRSSSRLAAWTFVKACVWKTVWLRGKRTYLYLTKETSLVLWSSACLSPLDLFASLLLSMPLQLSMSFQLFLLFLLPPPLLLQTLTLLKRRRTKILIHFKGVSQSEQIPEQIFSPLYYYLLFILPSSPAPPSPAPPTSPAPSSAAPAEPDVSSPTPGSPSQSSPSSCPQRSLVEIQIHPNNYCWLLHKLL